MQIERRAVCTECNEAAPRVRKGKKFKLCEDCRRAVTTKKWKVRKAQRQLRNEIGHVIEFNEGEGWRTGYLVEAMSVNARVQPIGACGRVPDILTVCLADVKIPTCGSPSMPTIEDFYRKMESMKMKKPVVLVAQPKEAVSKTNSRKKLTKEPPDSPVIRQLAAEQETELAWDEAAERGAIRKEEGDTSFPFGANAPKEYPPVSALVKGIIDSAVVRREALVQETAVSVLREHPVTLNSVTPKQKKPKADAIIAGVAYGPWKALEYTGHSRWKCVSDSGEEKVLYSAELRTAAAAK